MARNVKARAVHFRRGLNFFTLGKKPFIHSFKKGRIKYKDWEGGGGYKAVRQRNPAAQDQQKFLSQTGGATG